MSLGVSKWKMVLSFKILVHIESLYSGRIFSITKTRLYNFDPLKPHFYTIKLGFPGVYNIFRISAENIDCGYSLELSHRGTNIVVITRILCSENLGYPLHQNLSCGHSLGKFSQVQR